MDLIINEDKTKYLRISRNKGREDKQQITIGEHKFENVRSFKYLGTHLNSENNMHEKIAHRTMAANRAYYSLIKLFRTPLISRTCKFLLYKTIIRPILCYGAETWTMTTTDESNLRIFEKRILRKIFDPVKENNIYRIRYNHELEELTGNEDIVRFIKG